MRLFAGPARDPKYFGICNSFRKTFARPAFAGDAPAPDYAHTQRHVEARERAVATLEKSLGAARYAELYARGKVMNDFDAVHYARAAIRRVLAAPQ